MGMGRLAKILSPYLTAACVCCIIVFSTSCENTDNLVVFERKDVPPLTNGNFWRYRITDYSTSTIDTLKLLIAGSATTGGTQVCTCLVQHGAVTIDTAYLTVSDSTMIFAANHGGYASPSLSGYALRLPFTVTSNWPYDNAPSNVTVTGFKAPYPVLGSNYNVFTLALSYSEPDNTLNENFAVMKTIGLIDLSYEYDDLIGIHRRSQQFIDCQLH